MNVDWTRASQELDAQGWAVLAGLLSREECEALAGLYADDRRFRSRVEMRRHGYGSGEYKYFAYPLPASVQRLRAALYSRLAPIADRWNEAMGVMPRISPASA